MTVGEQAGIKTGWLVGNRQECQPILLDDWK